MSGRRRRAGDPRIAPQIYRERRHANAVQIRKQKKEERLNRRRQRESPVSTLSSHDVMGSLDALLLDDNSIEKLVQLQTCMKASASGTNTFLEQLLEHHEDKARSLVAILWRHVQQSTINSDEIKETLATCFASSLLIFLDLSSSLASRKPAADDYYGSTPLRWSDLMLADESAHSPLVQLLLQQLSRTNKQQVLETISNILGNLVQDASSQVLKLLLPSWSLIVQKLPVTAYLCAAIVRQDGTHYARDFLQDLTPHHIVQLLSRNETAADAAWILEGLSRREPDAADMLCREQPLLEAMLQVLEHASAEAIVPTLQAVDNLVDRKAGLFLSMPRFVQIWTNLLQSSQQKSATVLRNTIYVTGSFLIDAGLPNHLATNVAAPTFLPILVNRCISPETVHDVKRDALWAIEMAMTEPELSQLQTTSENTSAEYMLMKIRSCHQDMIRTCLWESMSSLSFPETNRSFLQLLIDFIANSHDLDGATAAIRILDRILRIIPSSQTIFEQCDGGVDALDQLCLREEGSEAVATLAADLLDEFFEDEDDENAPGVAEESEHFVFGQHRQPSRTAAFNFTSPSPAPPMGRGRGRGMTTPAWMQESR